MGFFVKVAVVYSYSCALTSRVSVKRTSTVVYAFFEHPVIGQFFYLINLRDYQPESDVFLLP